MKKNFFKKLSFVLALAMIVTALAPAAGAFAAKAPKLNASSKYLYLSVDGKDEFDFNISNKVKGWKYLWTSANEDVASVNKKNGLTTAEGAGTTKVSVVITDKDGEEVDELTATVTVRDNIKELTITNLPTDSKVAVGVAHDFNRSYVTVANKTKGSKAITRWTVTPSEGATISDSGVFTATKAGEYTITARAFQSKAKYTSWLSDATKYASYVTSNEATYKVTVAASLVEVKQNNLAKFNMTFDTAMTADDVKKNTVVSYMVGDVKIKEQLIKEVKVVDGSDNKKFTVEMTDEFYPGYTYVVSYTDLGEKEFIAATTKVEDVVGIDIVTTKATIYEANTVEVNLLNKDGVIINQPDDNGKLETRVSLESSNNLASLSGTTLYMYNLNDTTTIKAIFHTYNYNTSTGKEEVFEDTQVVTCVEKTKDLGKSLLAWTIVGTSDTPNFDDAKHFLALEETKRLFVKIKKLDDKETNSNVSEDASKFEFNSSNTSVLFVDNAGYLYPVKEGTVKVTVEYNDAYVGSFDVTVSAKKFAASLELSVSDITVSNTNNFADEKPVKGTLKDQFGNEMGFTNLNYEVVGAPLAVRPDGKTLHFSARNLAKGTYQYKVWADGENKIVRYVKITVVEPTAGQTTPSYYRLEVNSKPSDTVDLKVKKDDVAENVTLKLFGYASNGAKLTEEAFDDADGFTVKVKSPDKDKYPTPYVITGSSISLINASAVTGSVFKLEKEKTGTYEIEAYQEDGVTLKSVAKAVLNVTDTQAKPSITKVTTFWANDNTTAITVGDAFKDAFEVKVNGTEITDNFDDNRLSFTITGMQASNKIYIKEAMLYEVINADNGNTYRLYHTVPVGYYMTVPANFQY